jgi:hypothetical protein
MSIAVVAWGRANPPTIGHEKLFDKTIEHADEVGGKAHIFVSHSQDNKKNPLSSSEKVNFLKKAYKGKRVTVGSSSPVNPSILHIAKQLNDQGHDELHLVAGSDRIPEYKTLLNKYNGKEGHYNFKKIEFVSAGERDPDAEGTEGISGTKMRSHAISGNKEEFKNNVLSKLSDEDKEQVYKKTRTGMGFNEDYENPYRFDWATPEGTQYMKKMTPHFQITCPIGEYFNEKTGKCEPKGNKMDLRERYISGELFNLGETVVTTDNVKGEIVYRGSNYVTLRLANESTVKRWIKDIQLNENGEEKKERKDFKEYVKKTPKQVTEIKYSKFYKERMGIVEKEQLPFLLMNDKQKQDLKEEKNQLEYAGYKTKNFDRSSEAYKIFSKLIDEAGPHITTSPVAQVQAGIAVKPRELKHMQFKQYVGI